MPKITQKKETKGLTFSKRGDFIDIVNVGKITISPGLLRVTGKKIGEFYISQGNDVIYKETLRYYESILPKSK